MYRKTLITNGDQMSAKELLQNWQESLEQALAKDLNAGRQKKDQPQETLGLQLRTGVSAGGFWDFLKG